MNERYAELFGISELAESLEINKSYLIRRFKKEVGIPPGKYLQTVRIKQAKQLLHRPQYSLEVIAALCGFSGANYFCKVFKKETGETPTTWRNRTATASETYSSVPENDEIYL